MVEKVIKHMPFLIISFFEKVQVSPELYGDTRPRFFIYWTVKQKKKMWFGLFRYCISICYNLVNFRMAWGGRLMLTNKQGATISYAQGLYKRAMRWGLPSHLGLHRAPPNMISKSSYGRFDLHSFISTPYCALELYRVVDY